MKDPVTGVPLLGPAYASTLEFTAGVLQEVIQTIDVFRRDCTECEMSFVCGGQTIDEALPANIVGWHNHQMWHLHARHYSNTAELYGAAIVIDHQTTVWLK